jgi:hypothetical protein
MKSDHLSTGGSVGLPFCPAARIVAVGGTITMVLMGRKNGKYMK